MNTQILKVLHYIENNLDEHLDLCFLAKLAGYSPYYFCRIFKHSVGESIMSYASKLKINRASFNIINSKKSIIEIALDIGFETPNGFNKSFKKVFNMTPTQYREKHNLMILNYKEKNMKIPKIVQRDETHIIYISKYGAYKETAPLAWQELIQSLDNKKRVNILSNNELFGICYNDPETTAIEDIRYDAAISINTKDLKEYKELGFNTEVLEDGRFVSVSYKGDKESNQTWMDLFAWIAENDLSKECKNRPPFEKYINWSPDMKDEELIKEIYIPLN